MPIVRILQGADDSLTYDIRDDARQQQVLLVFMRTLLFAQLAECKAYSFEPTVNTSHTINLEQF